MMLVGRKGWSANYVLSWREGTEWRLIRNLVEMWLTTGARVMLSFCGIREEKLGRRFFCFGVIVVSCVVCLTPLAIESAAIELSTGDGEWSTCSY